MTTLFFAPYQMNCKTAGCAPDNTRTQHYRHPMHSNKNFNTPPANIIKGEKGYELQLSLPGFSKENINIQVAENTLNIEGRINPTVSENEKVLRKEFSSKDFKRSFTIGDVLDANTIDAAFQNGILSIKIAFKPTPEPQKPNTIEVK
ncbi:MAG TPA: Hsp20/alpha crystallin family protein [Saprospiraceae bacterium]|nr:Hsp20/alpha crystallin family protein [Saprospiraceae bacterium]MCC6687740.1 Hsp20/alpha crystallin family protein [Saprospiraceae bacterium]HMX82806.1 Hsp20/alpha crystallin family protein [Saprospiraceae bacterium]HMZ73082.1 Hsp20/alpha crystallin family protein [Saprospiraceae bacterium]HNA40486.1 Hsp20/alpha crystallin family protein [Saprospiraceae bacterium]